MNRLFKFFWILSLLLFMVGLLWIYAFLPEKVGIQANEFGIPNAFISRDYFFYIALLAFIFSNGLLFALYKLLMVSRNSDSHTEAVHLRSNLASWLLGLAGALNIIFLMAMSFFSLINTTENYDVYRYAPLVYGGPVLLLIMFGLLIYILMKRKGQITG